MAADGCKQMLRLDSQLNDELRTSARGARRDACCDGVESEEKGFEGRPAPVGAPHGGPGSSPRSQGLQSAIGLHGSAGLRVDDVQRARLDVMAIEEAAGNRAAAAPRSRSA